MRYLVVAVAGFVLGGWAVPLGFVLDLSAIESFIAASVGGLVGLWAFLLAGDQIARFAERARGSDDDAPVSGEEDSSAENEDAAGRVGAFVDRYGVRGLGLVGPIFPGVTVSVIGGLALDLDRQELGKWMTIGIIVLYGLYALGLSLLIELF